MKQKTVTLITLLLAVAALVAQEAPKQESDIPAGSSLYIAPAPDNFNIDVAGALRNKGVNLVVVNDESKAAYKMDLNAENKGTGWARTVFKGQWSEGTASATITNVRTGVLVWAYNVHKVNKRRQSTAEAIAKHLKDHVK